MRTIIKPLDGRVPFFWDVEEQLSGWSVDASSGVIIFSVSPANAVEISAHFEFYVPVRFDTDRILAALEYYGSYALCAIMLVDFRPF